MRKLSGGSDFALRAVMPEALPVVRAEGDPSEPTPQLFFKCLNCPGTGFVFDDEEIEDNCHVCDKGWIEWDGAALEAAEARADAAERKLEDVLSRHAPFRELLAAEQLNAELVAALKDLRAMVVGEHGASAYENINGERADAALAQAEARPPSGKE